MQPEPVGQLQPVGELELVIQLDPPGQFALVGQLDWVGDALLVGHMALLPDPLAGPESFIALVSPIVLLSSLMVFCFSIAFTSL